MVGEANPLLNMCGIKLQGAAVPACAPAAPTAHSRSCVCRRLRACGARVAGRRWQQARWCAAYLLLSVRACWVQ